MKNFKVGDQTWFAYAEFDGSGIVQGVVTEVHEDSLIMRDADGVSYWCDFESVPGSTTGIFKSKMEAKVFLRILRKEDIKIISVEDCTDPAYGNSIVKYSFGEEFISYFFSKEYPDQWKENSRKIKNEIVSHINNNDFPKWTDLSEELLDIISENPFDMYFLEYEDKEWNEDKADAILAEVSTWNSLYNVVTVTERDCYLTIFAGAMCSVNWYGHPIWDNEFKTHIRL